MLHFSVRSGMSDHEEGTSREEEATSTEPTRYVRVSLHLPSRYAASKTDSDLWFELYVKRIDIPQEQWAAELLPLLDDEAFRVVSQQRLESFTDYVVITASLKQGVSQKLCGCWLIRPILAGLQNREGRSSEIILCKELCHRQYSYI